NGYILINAHVVEFAIFGKEQNPRGPSVRETMDEGGGGVQVLGEEEQGEEWAITSPLHLAAYSGDLSQLQEALKEMPVDSVDEYGRTPVMYAAMADREDCVELLVKKGASPNIQVH
ncbi:Inversin, partial [Geodia barretti]